MDKLKTIAFALIGTILFLMFNAIYITNTKTQPKKENNMKLTSVFEHMGEIPSIYTCDGQDLAPVLNISDVPENAQELALIVDDPDAPVGNWVHWVLYNIPTNTTSIDNQNLAPEIKQGTTDFGRIGWGGPCPPDREHRYFFKLYALDKKLDLPSGITKKDLEHEIEGHIIEQTELIGRYDRLSRRQY